MPDSFKKWWQTASDEDKQTFNQRFDNQYGPGCPKPALPSPSLPTKVYSSDVVPRRSINFMDQDNDVLTPEAFQHWCLDNRIVYIADLQAFTTHNVPSRDVDGGATGNSENSDLSFSINNMTIAMSSNKRQSSNRSSNRSASPPSGSIIRLLKDRPKGSVVTFSQNDKQLQKIQIWATEIDFTTAQRSQSFDDDVDNDHIQSHTLSIEEIDDDDISNGDSLSIDAIDVWDDNSNVIEIDDDDISNGDSLSIDAIDVQDDNSNVIKIDGLDVLLHPDYDDVVANDNEIPSLISRTSNADDASSGDEASADDVIIDDDTIDGDNGPLPLVSTPDNDNDAENDFASVGYKPPKWFPFTNGYGKVLQYIIVENVRQTVPYQEAPLAPMARCDQLPTYECSKRKRKKKTTYSVSAHTVKQVSKKKGDSLCNHGANGGIVASDMRPMDILTHLIGL